MLLRALPFATLLFIPAIFVGCQEVREPESSRPQRIAQAAPNRFKGDWGPGAGYVANDWLVRFSSDGRISVKGPGMTARGEYVASDTSAEAIYAQRDGRKPSEDNLRSGIFSLSPDGRELTFSTGLPSDPPVHLVRAM